MLEVFQFVQDKHDFIQTILLLSLLGIAAGSLMLIKFIITRAIMHMTGWKDQVDTLLSNSPAYQRSTTEHLTSILECQQAQSVTLDGISSLLADQKAHNARIDGEIKILHMKNDNTSRAICEVKKSLEQNSRVISDVHNRTTVLENSIKTNWQT